MDGERLLSKSQAMHLSINERATMNEFKNRCDAAGDEGGR